MSRSILRIAAVAAAFTILGLGLTGCPNIGQDDPETCTYDTCPIAITNPDWGVLPLPNNLLNPVFQSDIPLVIPGVEAEEEPPTGMNLPVVDDDTVAFREELGYPAVLDTELSRQLIGGMNKLDGYVPGFIPRIPVSQPIDVASLTPFEAELDGEGNILSSNAETANLFFLDITDRDAVKPIAPDKYHRIFNAELVETLPYQLTLRNTASLFLPDDFEQGHTYLMLMTGLKDDIGVKDTNGQPFWPDGYFSIFASENPYIFPDGYPRNNVIANPDPAVRLAKIQEAEGARQITGFGLDLWQNLVGESRSRSEVISATHFTITSNPLADFFDPAAASLPNRNPLLPKPADALVYDSDFAVQEEAAEADCNPSITFSLSRPLDADTVTDANIALYKMGSDDNYEAVDISVSVTNNDDAQTAAVTLTPDDALDPDSSYMVALSNRVKGKNGRNSADQTYFGLARVTTALIEDGQYLSPYLDSRVDTLIFMNKTGALDSLDNIDEEALQTATDTLARVLNLLEAYRKKYEKPITWLVDSEFVTAREDVALFWTFSTGACQ